jgi:2-amino-4-hydroxy-6-hydroxymethyldihydropteridine diphosphokinase
MAESAVPEAHRPVDIRRRGLRVSSPQAHTVFLGLGSNLGDRLRFLEEGVYSLQRGGVAVRKLSSVVETPAMGSEGHPPFLNLVVAGEWAGEPDALWEVMVAAERRVGRERPFPNAPRTLDVDLLFFGGLILRTLHLRVPHPRWKGRSFVVRPLQQVAPGFVDPETGLTVADVARLWPQQPREVSPVMAADEFNWRRT